MSIVLERVTKRMGTLRVVDDVSLEIADGELFVLLGASGSGKSTLLRLVAGLILPDGGRILLRGRDVTALPAQARGTGFVFQNYSLFRHMTVADNVEFGLRIRGVASAERAEKRDELLDLVELAGLGDHLPAQLSGGQRQRVALARALAYEPSVLLLDEPFGALDARIRAQLRRSLREVQDRLRTTTILVTHDQEEAFDLGDRIGIIERGELLEVNTPEGLYARPRSLFAATFVGSGTVLAGRAVAGMVQFGQHRLPIPAGVPFQEGTPLPVLVRPERVALDAAPPDDGRPVLGQGVVIEDSFMGGQRRLRLRIPRILGCRQLAPRTPFGEAGILVDAVVPAEVPVPSAQPWVSIRDWHVLERTVPDILVCAVGEGGNVPVQLIRSFAEALRATVTVLGVAEHPADAARVEQVLERFGEALEGRDATRQMVHGLLAEQILAEQSESGHELTILAVNSGDPANSRPLDALVNEVVGSNHGPVLVAKRDRPIARSVLICTAAGEPGKGDVFLGGLIARRLGLSVTLLYVAVRDGSPNERVRTHLDRANAALAALDVACEVHVRPAATAAEGILAEVREDRDRFDLVVVGGHGPQLRSGWSRDNVTLQVVAGCDLPVLVVPTEWAG